MAQDPDQGAGAAGFQAALTQHDRVRRSTDIPVFYGDERRDTVTPHQLIKRIEGAAVIAHWDTNGDEALGPRKCDELYMCLRSSALSWFNSLKDLGVSERRWPDLKAEFLDAYAPRFSARTLCTSFQDLKQKPEEKVQTFFHRVADAFSDAYRSKPVAVTTFTGEAAERGAATVVYADALVLMGVQKMQLLMMSTIFLGGLKDEIRVRVLENGPEDIRTALKLAREVEVILGDASKRPKGVAIASLADLNDIDEDEGVELVKTLNAIRSGHRGGGRSDSSSRGSSSRGRGDGRSSKTSDTGRPTFKCFYCDIVGHIAKECFKKARDVKNGVDVSRKPGVSSIQDGTPRRDPGAKDENEKEYNPAPPDSAVNTICSFYAGLNHLN